MAMGSPIIRFPMNTKRTRTPVRRLCMDDALTDALVEYGKRTGIGNFSAVVRFACASLLRTDGALPVSNEKKASAS